jgi:hypothetical protein
LKGPRKQFDKLHVLRTLLFEFKEEGVLIIGTDNTYDKAENAVIAALFALVGDKIIIS